MGNTHLLAHVTHPTSTKAILKLGRNVGLGFASLTEVLGCRECHRDGAASVRHPIGSIFGVRSIGVCAPCLACIQRLYSGTRHDLYFGDRRVTSNAWKNEYFEVLMLNSSGFPAAGFVGCSLVCSYRLFPSRALSVYGVECRKSSPHPTWSPHLPIFSSLLKPPLKANYNGANKRYMGLPPPRYYSSMCAEKGRAQSLFLWRILKVLGLSFIQSIQYENLTRWKILASEQATRFSII